MFFSPTCHALVTWLDLSRVKLYKNDLKGNKNCELPLFSSGIRRASIFLRGLACAARCIIPVNYLSSKIAICWTEWNRIECGGFEDNNRLL